MATIDTSTKCLYGFNNRFIKEPFKLMFLYKVEFDLLNSYLYGYKKNLIWPPNTKWSASEIWKLMDVYKVL